MLKKVMAVIVCFVISAFSIPSSAIAKSEPIEIVDKGSHYEITMNYDSGVSHNQMGVEYGKKVRQNIPEYEALLDSYIAEISGGDNFTYQLFLSRVKDIIPQINQEYKDEIDGIASVLSGGSEDKMGDNKISKDEFYLFNLLPDVARSSQCSAFSVFGKRSEYTDKTMTARLLDWYQGSQNQITKIQVVQTIKNCNKSICTIGYLGFMGVITGINDDKLFAAILDSSTGMPYTSASKYSYPFEIRRALESYDKMKDVTDYLKSKDRNYTVSHNIFLSDKCSSAVLEDNVGAESGCLREVRTTNSKLNNNISWGISDSVGCVNSFIIKGNTDNHTPNTYNTKRWDSMKAQAISKGSKITLQELKEIASYHKENVPGDMSDGDIYNNMTQQVIIFIPYKMQMEVFFRPETGALPEKPTFEKVQIKF